MTGRGKPTAIIIGAGIGGLATANLLSKTGWQVTVIEQTNQAGGRAGWLEANGFSFDTGPSWYLMPEVYEHYFQLLGEDVHAHLNLVRLEPAYRVFYEQRQPITVYSQLAGAKAVFEQVEPGAGNQLQAYLTQSKQTYELAQRYFLYNTFSSFGNLLRADILRHAPQLVSQLLRPIDAYVNKFVSSRELRQILEYPMVFLGTSPFSAPAMYSLMSHLDFTQGVFYPMGGMYNIIKALVNISHSLGVTYRFNTSVTEITVANKRATGVVLNNGSTVAADLIVSNADLHFTETQLLAGPYQSYPNSFWTNRTASPSALLLYLGIKGKLPTLTHHNLFFVDAWKENFDDLLDRGIAPEKASLYVSKPSHTDPSVAPKDHENVFVLVPLPADPHISNQASELLANRYLCQIAVMTGIRDLQKRIVYRKMFTPAQFETTFHAWHGAALGMAHTLTQSAFFRPSNKSKKLANLFYVGANTQPGIGLPMCLISAELIYKHLIDDTSSGPVTNLRPSI